MRGHLVGWVMGLTLALAGCGGDAVPQGSGGGPGGGANGPRVGTGGAADRPAPPDPARRPVAPPRLFERTLAPMDPRMVPLYRRIDPGPAGDAWPGESVAGLAQRFWTHGLEQSLEGNAEIWAGLAAANFRGSDPLVPPRLETLADDGVLRARRGAVGGQVLDATGLVDAMRALVEPFVADPDRTLRVECVECLEVEPSVWRTTLGVHLASDRAGGAGRIQRDLRLAATWRVGRKLRLQQLERLSFDEVVSNGPTYVELTEALLGDTPLAGDGNLVGAVELTRRTDRMHAPTAAALGMHGLGVGDLDGDGREDLYVARHGGVRNLLLLAQPDGTLREAPAGHGADVLDDTCGVLVCDLDGDGARDLCLSVYGSIVILWNDGTGRFPTRTQMDTPEAAQVYTVVAADADGDGDLDLYDTRYHRGQHLAQPPLPYHDARNGAPNHFWRQLAPRSFQDQTAQAGLDDGNDRYSLAALWEDLDRDGDLDLYVTNDFGRNNLYLNDGEGRFHDAAGMTGTLDMAAGMGVSAADVDRNGVTDLYVSNMFSAAGSRITADPRFMQRHPLEVRAAYGHHAAGNTLLLGEPDGTYVDAKGGERAAGGSPSHAGWSWGSVLLDWDNDGLSDAFAPNGFTTMWRGEELASFFWRVVVDASPATPPMTEEYSLAQQLLTHLGQIEGYSLAGDEDNAAFWNVGAGRFVDARHVMRLGHADDGRSAVALDWDGDGRLDLWTKNRTAPLLRFHHNRLAQAGNWISFELAQGAPNPEAVGALVEVTTPEGTLARRVYAGEGYLATSTKRRHFGLGGATAVSAVRVTWPDGEVEEHGPLSAGRLYRWTRGGAPEAVEDLGVTGLADRPDAPIPAGLRERTPRVPLLAPLPWTGWRLPTFDGRTVRVGDHDGALLVVLWAAWSDEARATLRELAGAWPALAAEGLALHPLSLDAPQDEAWARADVAQLDLPELGGRADSRTRGLIDVLTSDVIGAFEDLALPLSLLFDDHGDLVALYVGGLDLDVLRTDLDRLDAQAGESRRTLERGTWFVARPTRNYETLAEFMERNSEPELAESLRAIAERE